MRELQEEAADWLQREGVQSDDHAFSFYADCRYYMQDIQLPCSLELSELDDGYGALLRTRFEGEHHRRYGFELDAPIEIATVRVVGAGAGSAASAPAQVSLESSTPAARREEQVFFADQWHPAGIFERERLAPGHRIEGPAIVEQQDTTTVIEPGRNRPLWDPQAGGQLTMFPSEPDFVREHDIDPITLDIIENTLSNTRYEMDRVLETTAVSPVIREQSDQFPLIADLARMFPTASASRSPITPTTTGSATVRSSSS